MLGRWKWKGVPMMRIIIIFLMSISLSSAEMPSLIKGKITWSKLKELEPKMEKWAESVGEKDLVVIGEMRQRPDEVAVIRYFFPHLLPKGFFGRDIDLSCYPSFREFEKNKNLKAYTKWHKCVRSIYNETLPEMLKQAAKDLKPRS